MEITDTIKNRRTVRRYKSKKIPVQPLKKILDAARWAPSLHNLQPWKFVIPEGEIRKRIIKVIKSRRAGESVMIRVTLKNSIEIIENAPLIILVYNNRLFSKKFKKGSKLFNRAALWEVQSIASAIQNMLLVAHSLGLGTAWLGIPLLREKRINKILDINEQLMAIITMGYPRKKPNVPRRKPLSETVSFVK